MRFSTRAFGVAVFSTLLLMNCDRLFAQQTADMWLRSSGKDLLIRLKGEVFHADGSPANEVTISGLLNTSASDPPLNPTVEGHRFEVLVPVNQSPWHSLWLKATSAQGEHIACLKLNAFELRQAATEGVKLTLQSPVRRVAVHVSDKGNSVADATVQAELDFGIKLRALSNAKGVAHFDLLPQQSLTALTAWTEDFRIGGFSFNRKPTRDPNAQEHIVELSKCRSQKLRFVDEQGAPAPGIDFVLQVATASPNYNFLGTNEFSSMTSDACGEAAYPWFPDWENCHVYAEFGASRWVLEGEPEVQSEAIVFKVKQGRERKQIRGRVISPDAHAGGFLVTLDSFQGERENYRDVLSTFTDPDGAFSVEVLPDATYCAFAVDARWVSDIIDLIPYRSESGQFTPIQLAVSEGQPVELVATSGPQQRPYANLTANIHREHVFSWRQADGEHRGTGGPQWWTTTDGSGRATVHTLPGKLSVSVYTPLWRTETAVEVRRGEAATIKLHREVDEKQHVTGRLVLAEGLVANLEDAQIELGAIDGDYDFRQTLTCGKDGSFAGDVSATRLGVFAATKDGQAAGSVIIQDLDAPIEVRLHPTSAFQGRLLGENDAPLVGHRVWGVVRIEGRQSQYKHFATSFEAKRIETTTNEQGEFRLVGAPCQTKVALRTNSLHGSISVEDLGAIYLQLNNPRPPAIFRLNTGTTLRQRAPLAERFQTTLRDALLSGFRAMVILSHGGQTATRFIDENLVDPDAQDDVAAFLQLTALCGPEQLAPGDLDFLKSQRWALPTEGRIAAYALDAQGRELGRLEIDPSDPVAAQKAAEFVRSQAPPRDDAEQNWRDAFAKAKATDRRVWVRISQRNCGPCFRLARWIDDQRGRLEKDYIMLKIDDVRDQNGAAVAERLTRGESYGVPFHAIFDEEGAMLINSNGPLGNIGYPCDFEGKTHLRKMLLQSRRQLTEAEIEELIQSLAE